MPVTCSSYPGNARRRHWAPNVTECHGKKRRATLTLLGLHTPRVRAWQEEFAYVREVCDAVKRRATSMGSTLKQKNTERITRRNTPREVRCFRVYGQPTSSSVHWHLHKSSLPEEENRGDTSETRTRDHGATSCVRYHGATPAAPHE